MKIIIFSLLIFFGIMILSVSSEDFAFGQFSNKLTVSFENNVSSSYDVSLSSNGKYVLNQSYSWVKDESSRYNLVSYSIDGEPSILIPRTPRGTFTLEIPDGSSQLVFSSTVQYPLTISGTNDYTFLPTSPSNDNWFDSGSAISVTIPTTTDIEKNKVRKGITGWALDKNQFRNLPDDESSFFITPPIQMTESHVIDFVSTTQYKLNVISEIGTTTGSGWYKQDDEVVISADTPNEGLTMNVLIGWEGPIIESDGNSAKVIIDGPTTITAKWEQNSSLVIIMIVVPILILIVIITKKFKKTKRSEIVEQTRTVNSTIESTETKYKKNYDEEISKYLSQGVLEKIESMHESNLISDSKYSKIKESL